MKKRNLSLLIFGIVVAMTSVFIVVSSANGDRDLNVDAKTEKRIAAAHQDLKATLKLEKELSKYREIVGEEVNQLDPSAAKELDDMDQTVPVGSVQPFYYISDDNKSIILLYKAADGTNVMVRSIAEDKKWKRTESFAKGSPILVFEDEK